VLLVGSSVVSQILCGWSDLVLSDLVWLPRFSVVCQILYLECGDPKLIHSQ
jgi:hypothetical protein